MRTKQTYRRAATKTATAATRRNSKARQSIASMPESTPTTPAGPRRTEDHRTPQPVLSEDDVLRLRAYLDRGEPPFTIAMAPARTEDSGARKRKRAGDELTWLQDDLWEDRLSIAFEVRPKDKWESLRRYKKFTVGAESISLGQCILVKHAGTADEAGVVNTAAQWKARVLEVRALDQEHVYLRVSWLNRPEDLPAGRKPHHGRCELIPTNQLDIIDAMATNGTLDVVHWPNGPDDDDEGLVLADDQYFWRQTYDYVGKKGFSKLKKICVDHTPQNPDEVIVQCPSASCRTWLHTRCIAERAVRDAHSKQKPAHKAPAEPAPSASSAAVLTPPGVPVARAEKDGFTAAVFLADKSPQSDAVNGVPTSTDTDGDTAMASGSRPTSRGGAEVLAGVLSKSIAGIKHSLAAAVAGATGAAEDKTEHNEKADAEDTIMVDGVSAGANGPEAEEEKENRPPPRTQIIVTYPDGRVESQGVQCLACGAEIEDD